MSYARARLWIGISGVGLNVLIASGILLLAAPDGTPADDSSTKDAIWVVFAAYVLWMLPFDFLGGWWLPRRYGRSQQSATRFCVDWASGVLLQSIVFAACGASVIWAARVAGLGGGVALLLLSFITLLAMRPLWVRIFSRSAVNDTLSDVRDIQAAVSHWGIDAVPIVFREGPTSGFTGGIVGMLRPGIVFPDQWRSLLSHEEIAALAARRSLTISTGSHTMGLIVAGLWTLSAFVVGNWGAGTLATGPQTACDLLNVIAGATLWNFLGLLILPSVSRFAARRLDGMTIARIPQELLKSAQEKVDRVQDDEPHRPLGVEMIFHPVPSVALRKHRELTAEGIVPWHLARQVLFLSWALCNPLARAVHCNAGQSLLWICPPTD